jgi:hypothetical protein
MNLFIVAWRAFPAAPETSRLKNLRLHSMLSLMLTAMLIAWTHLLWLLHPFAVLIVPLAGIHAFIITGRYWFAKTRADERYQAILGASDAESAVERPAV